MCPLAAAVGQQHNSFGQLQCHIPLQPKQKCQREEMRHLLKFVAFRTIRSSSTHAIELLRNYGIGYWIPYILTTQTKMPARGDEAPAQICGFQNHSLIQHPCHRTPEELRHWVLDTIHTDTEAPPAMEGERGSTVRPMAAALQTELHSTRADSIATQFPLCEGKDPSVVVQDGDGGYLIAEYFPEIAQLAHTLGVPCQKVQPHGLTLFPFRENGHDAPELGHVYHIDMGRVAGNSIRADSIVVPFGYHALVHARRLIAQCTSVIVVPHVVEIYRQTQDTLNLTVPTGVERIQAGLSYPYGDDQRYMQAYNIAQRNGVGLHQYHLVDDRLLPGALKQQLQDNLGARVTHRICH